MRGRRFRGRSRAGYHARKARYHARKARRMGRRRRGGRAMRVGIRM